jgi:hypothetical protein
MNCRIAGSFSAPQRAFRTFAAVIALCCTNLALAQGISISVGPDETLTYPSNLTDLADEHTTIFPPAPGSNNYLFFASSGIKGGSGGTVVLQTSDLTNFAFATGYPTQVMTPPIAFTTCKTVYDPEFDLNYAAPGSVVQDPTLPPGNLIMIYEAENHCPGAVWQHDFYATVGFARSSDNGKTWPSPTDSVLGGPNRYPVLKGPTAEPSTAQASPIPLGNAIPSAIVATNGNNESYLYVVYSDVDPASGADGMLRMARAKLGGAGQISFLKWYNGAYTEPGIGGLDSDVLPSKGCTARQGMGQISYSDPLRLYVMFFVCVDNQKNSAGVTQAYQAAWYFSTATSLDLQDWTPPHLVAGSQFPLLNGCASDGTGQSFDGWYPSMMSPGAAAGHISNTGKVFFMSGCDRGQRQYMSRTFTITGPAYNGLWWNPNESGWGMSITEHTGTIFSAIYTYDQSGAPTWYTIPNCPIAAGSSCSGALYKVTGGTNPVLPWNGSGIVVSSAGSGTLAFTDANNGTFNFTINGVTSSKAISRGIVATGSTAPAVDYTDLWWNTSQSGWGVALTHQYAMIFVAWYTYDASGKAIWYVASNCPLVGTGCTGTLYQVTGGSPLTSVWNGSHTAITPVGSVSFAFSDANNGTMSYTINGISASRAITRFTN